MPEEIEYKIPSPIPNLTSVPQDPPAQGCPEPPTSTDHVSFPTESETSQQLLLAPSLMIEEAFGKPPPLGTRKTRDGILLSSLTDREVENRMGWHRGWMRYRRWERVNMYEKLEKRWKSQEEHDAYLLAPLEVVMDEEEVEELLKSGR